ncbi:MAG: TolC family protein, partial [Candidatus Binatia bacterium]
MSERRFSRVAVAGVSLLCSSCLVGPDFEPPDIRTPPGWSAPMTGGLSDHADPTHSWWKNFGDPLLDDLVARAIVSNLDVRQAVARVRAARAQRRAAASAFFPSLDGSIDYQRRRPSSTTASPTASREFDAFSIGFDSSWEIDLFGGIRRSNEQAVATLAAAGADLHDVLVSVLAEVASNYVEYRSLVARLAIARNNARSQADTLDLARWRFEAG